MSATTHTSRPCPTHISSLSHAHLSQARARAGARKTGLPSACSRVGVARSRLLPTTKSTLAKCPVSVD